MNPLQANTWAELLHALLRISHVVVGFAGLFLFWLVIFMKKGTRWHRFIGRCFVLTAFFVGGSAIFSSAWALLHLESFAPYVVTLADDVQAEKRSQYQFLFSLLLFLAIATVTGALYGLHLIRLKDNVAALRRTSLPYWQCTAAVTGFGLVVFAGYHLAFGSSTGGMPREAYWLPLVLGGFGFSETLREMRQVFRPMAEPHEWFYRHVEQMFGTGVAFHTAFLVFGARVWLAPYLNGPLMFVPWIAPLIIGGFATKWYVARLKLQGHATTYQTDQPGIRET